ncbi:endolytic transglycosylase MltG [Virgibacillus senegalensis]|uniref:endolytic transglycosylase MltG n=1 Tax=Virgibacillus senegalensis TaxID=1499679 RepID=UPI00069EF588|nr:endolytic transglycosylase MltG [Virgibacillus senegalensis]
MKQPIRAFALGLLSAVLVLGTIYYIEGNSTKSKADISVSSMISQLESEGYIVNTPEEEQAEATEENNNQKKEEEEQEKPESTSPAAIDLRVEPGMNTDEIINRMYEAGIIEDKQSFTDYLSDHDYSTAIQTGEFHIREDMTYEEIAQTLTR